MGVGILASMAVSGDRELRLLDASHLCDENVTRIAELRGHSLRGCAYRFMELCSSDLTERVIRAKVDAPQGLD